MSDKKPVEDLVYDKIINTFKNFPTTIQDTLLKLIGLRLKELYTDIELYPETLLESNASRYDIVKAKAAQFNFNINNHKSLTEQINLLNSIYTIYSKRGSVESIENMWKYYGGDLPKDVVVNIPAYDIFRYSVSKLSGTHVLEDGVYYRAGVYTIIIDGDYDINTVKDFVLKELVTAGTVVNFRKRMFTYLIGENGIVSDNIKQNNKIEINAIVGLTNSGLTWSSSSVERKWSGVPNLFVDISRMQIIDLVKLNVYLPMELVIETVKSALVRFISPNNVKYEQFINIKSVLSCSSTGDSYKTSIHYYDSNHEEILPDENFPGYFILGKTKLREVILSDESK